MPGKEKKLKNANNEMFMAMELLAT